MLMRPVFDPDCWSAGDIVCQGMWESTCVRVEPALGYYVVRTTWAMRYWRDGHWTDESPQYVDSFPKAVNLLKEALCI